MLNLALWLRKNDFRLDQVQTFMPTPMALATTMYHTRKNPLHKVTADSEAVETVRTGKVRKLHKAFLRYHDPANWEIIREALQRMGRSDLIGSGPQHLVPRHGAPGTVSGSLERRQETPPVAQLAKKFGQNKPRPGAAVVRTPARSAGSARPATGRKPERVSDAPRGGRK